MNGYAPSETPSENMMTISPSSKLHSLVNTSDCSYMPMGKVGAVTFSTLPL